MDELSREDKIEMLRLWMPWKRLRELEESSDQAINAMFFVETHRTDRRGREEWT